MASDWVQTLLGLAVSASDRLLVAEIYNQGEPPGYTATVWGLDAGRSLFVWRDGETAEVVELREDHRRALGRLLEGLPQAGVRQRTDESIAWDASDVTVLGRVGGRTYSGNKHSPRIKLDLDAEGGKAESEDRWYATFLGILWEVGVYPPDRPRLPPKRAPEGGNP